jgi:predicted dehydrogenase
MNPIRLGIIGCGRVARQIHLPVLIGLPQLDVVALAESDPERLQNTADRFGVVSRYAQGEELLKDSRLEAIAICTPATTHAELAIKVLGAGKHVFVEKPLAVNVSDGEHMVAAAQATEKVCVVGFNLRCHRLVQRARDMLMAGTLGRIHQVATVWGSDMQHDPGMPQWRRRLTTGGGALTEIGVHHIDASSFLLQDKIDIVQMFDRSTTCEGESASLLAKTQKGTLISCSFSQVTSPIQEFRILGDRGAISFSPFRADSFSIRRVGERRDHWRERLPSLTRLGELPELFGVMRGGGDYLRSIREEWKAFAATVRGEAPPVTTFADGLAALSVIDAAQKSCATGTPVKVPN